MSKKLTVATALIVSAFIAGAFGSSQGAQAHSDIKDSSTEVTASFHVTPDHSPIAGRKSIISFDFSESEHHSENFAYALTIKKARENEISIPTELTRNVLLAEYVFPTQGLYTLVLRVTPKDSSAKPSMLTYNQRVSRGNVAEPKEFGKFETGVLAVVFGAIGILFMITFRDSMNKGKRKAGHEKIDK